MTPTTVTLPPFQYANTKVVNSKLTIDWTADISEGRTYFRADFDAAG